jgi:hypothetical protein
MRSGGSREHNCFAEKWRALDGNRAENLQTFVEKISTEENDGAKRASEFGLNYGHTSVSMDGPERSVRATLIFSLD